MSDELKEILQPETEIPWESAASFFLKIKEASVEEVADAKKKGVLSGIRSSTASDITHAERVKRTRGSRIGSGAGTAAGALAGALIGRRSRPSSRLVRSAIGAFLGRSAGKGVGEEVDRARILKRYTKPKSKKAEIVKHSSIQQVRELWKQAQGESPTDAIEGASGATPAPGAVDVAGTAQMVDSARGQQQTPAGPRIVPPSGAPTPEDQARARAMEQLEQEAALDQAAQQNEADHYRQVAEEMGAQLQEAQAVTQDAQMAADQASQQAQMAQQQADQATMQLQQQSQQDAMEKEQLNEQALSAKQNIMQMRQAMQAYRENLQQLALQDPTAMAGPSPEEQGMPEAGGAPPMPGQAGKEIQQAQKAEQEAQMQAAQADEAAAQEQAKQEEQEAVQEQAEAENQVKHSSFRTRAVGAMIGAGAGAGIQALSDRRGGGGTSLKENMLRTKLKHLKAKKNPTALDKHMTVATRALHDMARINRQHPGSAAAMAAISGAVAGAHLAPSVVKLQRSLTKATR